MTDLISQATEAVRTALESNPDETCLTCSFQAEDMVVLHIARQFAPRLPVLFLETGYHFAETLAYRDRVAFEWDLNLISLSSPVSVAAQEAQYGLLHQSDPGLCCKLRKVDPLLRGLESYSVWLTGLRREQSSTRANLAIVEDHLLPSGRSIRKVNPLAFWKSQDVFAYTAVNEIPLLPLYDQGYPSIGCEPCTQRPINPNDLRSGRWSGRKLECGIHTLNADR